LIVQCIAIIALSLLGFFGAFPIIWLTNKIIPLRLDPEEEEIGCDIVEHNIFETSGVPKNLIESFKLQPLNQLGIHGNFSNLNSDEIPQNYARQRGVNSK
jgi:hypothetical protein